jgi:hypothetical protein
MNTSSFNFFRTLSLTSFMVVGCAVNDPSDSALELSVGTACVVDADCDPRLECEVEHGVGTCQHHRNNSGRVVTRDGGSADVSRSDAPAARGCTADRECSVGLECEVEHGVGTCIPHRSADAGVASSDASRHDAMSTPPGMGTCTTDSNCASGLECEIEHGVGTCVPHRSADAGVTSDASRGDATSTPPGATTCTTDSNCASGLECEVEHGVGTCVPHHRGGSSGSGSSGSGSSGSGSSGSGSSGSGSSGSGSSGSGSRGRDGGADAI